MSVSPSTGFKGEGQCSQAIVSHCASHGELGDVSVQ